MANIYSLKTGVASDTTVWSGGVVPVSGDRVLICSGHVVTVDGTYTWGDDSTSTISINSISTTSSVFVQGTLKASRTVSSQITFNGHCEISTGGTLDYGTEADPIPAAYTAVIIVNKSAAPAHGKYGIGTSTTLNWAGFRLWGADKTPYTTMAAAASSDTVINVADATGWAVGDWVSLGPTVAGASSTDAITRAITAISGTAVTLGATLGVTSHAGRHVVNLTRNVRIQGDVGQTYRSFVSVAVQSTFPNANAIEIGPCEIRLTGGVTNQWQVSGLNLHWASNTLTTAAVKRVYRPVVHDAVSVSGSTVTRVATGGTSLLHFFGGQAYSYTVEEPILTSGNGMQLMTFYNGCATKVTNPKCIRGNTFASCGYSQGPVNASIAGGVASGLGTIASGSGVSMTFTNVLFDGIQRITDSSLTAFGSFNVESCTMGGTVGITSPTVTMTNAVGQYTPMLLNNCTLPSIGATRGGSFFSNLSTGSYYNFRNLNNSTLQQYIFRKGGRIIRDNSTVNRGQSSLAMYSWYAGVPLTHQSTASVGASATVRILGYARFNSTYGTATPPTLTVSGMGITPVVFTCTATADTWFPIDISVTNPQSYPGKFTLDFSAVSAANTETAVAWFDGIAMDDFVPWTRHYGFTYDPTNPARTVDPVVQLSESAAAALTGISYSAGTLTISSTKTIREVYDWMQWYECSNRLAPIMTSANGVSFTLAANLTLNAPLTGTGTIAMPTYTLTNTSTSTVVITHSAGVLVAISVTGLVNGSRVQLVDMTGPTELYNAVPGTSLALNANWTTNKTIRLRVGYASGATAKLPIETTGILSNTGASFLVSQVNDAVYNAIAIDGSTCTEFAPDYPNLQVDVSDGDGVTSVQRLYAWSAWAQTSSQGIAQMFQAVRASDALNFVIDVGVVNARLDNVTGAPVIVSGGYLSRSDGSTVIASTSGSIQMDPSKAYVAIDIATRVTELAQVHGLVAGTPLVVTPTSRTAGSVVQTISGDGVSSSTVSRV